MCLVFLRERDASTLNQSLTGRIAEGLLGSLSLVPLSMGIRGHRRKMFASTIQDGARAG